MIDPVYDVTLKNNLVVAKITGDWNIQADIGYLTSLDETISRVRNLPWALFADLRGWRVSEEVINFKHNNTIQLARSNQIAECWLVDSEEQGLHIQHHIENAHVPFVKVTSLQEAQIWLGNFGLTL
ncbi:hypothetical protein [Pseudoalteromonas spongiae]|uniref:hypothetical protein n=1 Tax=Pseudoalteromonas spongiae TaxID=298657 RepID=UPI00373501F3